MNYSAEKILCISGRITVRTLMNINEFRNNEPFEYYLGLYIVSIHTIGNGTYTSTKLPYESTYAGRAQIIFNIWIWHSFECQIALFGICHQ